MNSFLSWSRYSIVALAVMLCTAGEPAHADTYQVFNIGSGFRTGLIGIEASGAVVTYSFGGPCASPSPGCWQTWVNGAMVSSSPTNPNPAYDSGTPCTPSAPAGFGITVAACNNGREVYGTDRYTAPPYPNSIFTGPNPVADYFGLGPLDEVRLNSSGDFAFLAGDLAFGDGVIFQAIDLTTDVVPEPGSILLIGTGAVALLGSMRRRLFR